MAHWTQEIALVATLAATVAWFAPRVLLPPLAHSAPVTRASNGPPRIGADATPAPEIVLGDATSDDDTLASPSDDAPTAAPRTLRPSDHGPALHLARDAHARQTAPPGAGSVPTGAITRRDGRWVVDLDQIDDPRNALAGVHLQPLGEGDAGEGFAITRTDRQGLLTAAGIRPGDVLVGVNDMPTLTPDQCLDALARLRHATALNFRFRRGSSTFTVPVETRGDPRRLHGALVSSAGPVHGS